MNSEIVAKTTISALYAPHVILPSSYVRTYIMYKYGLVGVSIQLDIFVHLYFENNMIPPFNEF